MVGGVAVALAVVALLLVVWSLRDMRREKRYLEAVRRHPSTTGGLWCACKGLPLDYPGQELLCRDHMIVHSERVCQPFEEWVAPGR